LFSGAAVRADPFPHQFVSSLLCPPNYQNLASPSKPVAVVATQQPPQLQLQPQLLAQSAQQQYVPVSMVEQQTGRQVLLAQGGWSNNRQMTLVPSWQQLPGQHSATVAALQQPALLQAETSDWGRTLLVDPSAVQNQRSLFPVELPAEVYDTVSVVDAWANSKRGASTSHKSALFTLQVGVLFQN
jgi:homeodomain interacting protein kinase